MRKFNKNKQPIIAYALTLVVGLGLFCNVNQVVANTVTVQFNTNVNTNCKLNNVVAVAFGDYDPVQVNATAPLDAQGSFDIKCNKNGSGVIAIDNGTNFSSPDRRLKRTGSSDYLIYNLYTTAGRTTVWNSTNTVTYGPAVNNNYYTEMVYGRIPGAQVNAVAGSYMDTVVVTVTY